MRKSIRTALVAAGIAGAAALTASPAFAAGNPVAVTANVNQTISMTGPPATLTLAGDPGTNATGNVAYTITTNDPAGYHVTVSPSSTQFVNGGNSILNTALGYKPNGGTQVQFAGATPLSVNNKNTVSAGGGDAYTDIFSLAIPGNAAAGAYTETFTYLAVAN
jgi:hypothetical protein